MSLAGLVGTDYVRAVASAHAALTGSDREDNLAAMMRKIDFYPPSFNQRVIRLLPRVGARVSAPFSRSAAGATTAKFAAATRVCHAPLAGLGLFRVGEDGRLYLLAKSEHYHASLGHFFPGYRLIDCAKAVGIPNATHNNTRGHITRTLEEVLVRLANGINPADQRTSAMTSTQGRWLNRVLNLDTGSLAAEAALKLVLARFYRMQEDSPPPKYAGRIPVIIVVGDERGGIDANYHGTTMLTQVMRGLWPDLLSGLERQGFMRVLAVPVNDSARLKAVFTKYDKGRHKVAAFFHELVLMNYGAITLSRPFVRAAYQLCRASDAVSVVDEIQTGLWSPQVLMYREYGVRPNIVVLGKGLPGGEYAASRIIFDASLDCLPQFGALVTNGQEELASLAYLVTLRWVGANCQVASAVGAYYEGRLRELADRRREVLVGIEGKRHLAALHFQTLKGANAFVAALNEQGLDISVQTYKSACPPAALTKLPLTAGYEVVDFILEKMEAALSGTCICT